MNYKKNTTDSCSDQVRIFRIPKEKGYSVLSNIPATDKDLSFEARGMLWYLLTKPDDWIVRDFDLINQS